MQLNYPYKDTPKPGTHYYTGNLKDIIFQNVTY